MEIEFYIENSKPCRESGSMELLDERGRKQNEDKYGYK
jgi:hypothetical protein